MTTAIVAENRDWIGAAQGCGARAEAGAEKQAKQVQSCPSSSKQSKNKIEMSCQCLAPHYHGTAESSTCSRPYALDSIFSLRKGDAPHSIRIQLVSTLTPWCKCVPNGARPDRFVPLCPLPRRPLLPNRKEAPTRKRCRPKVIAFLASRHTVQHPR